MTADKNDLLARPEGKGNDLQPLPAVLMFQPKEYRFVPNEDVQQWENLLAERVGADKVAIERMKSGNPSISFCEFADDCDSV